MAALVAATVTSAGVSASIPAAAIETSPDESGGVTDGEIRFGRSLDDAEFLGLRSDSIDSHKQAQLQSIPFNPIDSLACDIQNREDHVLMEFETYRWGQGAGDIWPGGDVDLLCGTESSFGFKHIRERHRFASFDAKYGWEDVRQAASDALGHSAPQSWDQFMTAAIQDTIDYSNPDPTVRASNQTTCFSAPFHIWDGSKVVASFYANTIVSRTNFTIVTSYLSNNSQASACYAD